MRITSVKYLRDYVLEVTFYNKKKKRVNLKHFLFDHPHPSVRPFQDKAKFKAVKVQYGHLTWNDGQMDLSGESLYTWE